MSYKWAEEKGFQAKDEHILISQVPVQFLPTPDLLHEEAVKTAATLDFAGSPIRVLVDELRLAIAPVIVGQGRRLFGGTSGAEKLEPLAVEQTPPGLTLARYRCRGSMEMGTYVRGETNLAKGKA